jgi:hypothetical protein
VDWIQDGKVGSVGEVEAGLFFAGNWRRDRFACIIFNSS